MKKIIKSLALFAVIIVAFGSCQSQAKKAEVTTKKPASLEMSEDSLMIKSEMKAANKVRSAKEKVLVESVQTVIETRNSVQLLNNNKAKEAVKHLNSIIEKLDTITAKYPNLKLVPIDINAETNDLITNISTVKQIAKDAEKALKNEHLQEARELLAGLASEIDITTVNIPIDTYPVAINKAIKLIKNNKLNDAKTLLINTLNDLVIVKEKLPIPILQAEVLIDEAMARHLENRKQNKAIVINLLDNADYKLKLAEVLGYGGKDKVYEELHNDIKSLKKSTDSDADLKDLFSKLKTKLKKFKERLF